MSAPESNYVILAALQFDSTGDYALQEAVRAAEGNPRAELHVVHALASSFAKNGEPTSVAARIARAPERLREYVERACAGTELRVTAHIRLGSPVPVILQVAADLGADVIVLGTHTERGALGRLVMGSVAERVLHQARCPVLIAMPKAYRALAEEGAIEPPCADCVVASQVAGDPSAFCERHSHTRIRAHVYVPSDAPRPSMFGT